MIIQYSKKIFYSIVLTEPPAFRRGEHQWVFKTFTIALSDITYIIEIAKEDKLLCNTAKIIVNNEENIESLKKMISQYKSTIKEKDIQIENLEELLIFFLAYLF